MSRKVFDPTSYEYGRPGERAFRHFTEISGWSPEEKPEGLYGPDLKFMQDGVEFIAEVERMKPNRWNSARDNFRWPTLNQLADRRTGENIVHVQLCSDCSVGLVSFYKDHVASPIKAEDNAENQSEPIRKLPIERALLISLTEPAGKTLAEENRLRVKRLVVEAETPAQIRRAMRALVGDAEDQYGPPYGMSSEEWIELQQRLQAESGLLRDMKDGRRDPARPSRRPVQMSLF
jgi:hypothetical protein